MAGQHLRLFVACGTGTPFLRLLRVAERLLDHAEWDLFVQRGASSDGFAHLPGSTFITRDEFARRLAWADVVICHGGAGTLYEAHQSGHTPIAMPRLRAFGEHVNDHQEELVAALVVRGLAYCLRNGSELERLVLLAARKAAPSMSSRESPLSRAVAQALIDDHSTPGANRRGLLALPKAVTTRALSRLTGLLKH
jgi:UDP-N-acetylglucosamine transferase subunit ALG13